MPFNPQVPQPQPFAQELHPVEMQNPFDAVMKFRAQQQALAQGQQEQQINAQKLQAGQMGIDQTRAMNDAYRDSFTPGPDGRPTLDTTKLTSQLATTGHGSAIPGIIENWNKTQKSYADLTEAKQKIAASEQEAAGSFAAMVKAANYDPDLFHSGILDAMHRGILSPEHYGPIDQQLQQAQQADPTGQAARALVKQYADQFIAGSPGQQKLINEAKTAQGAEQRGQAATAAQTRLGFENNRKDAAAQLATARTPDEYTAVLNDLPHAVAKLFPPAAEVFDQTGKPTPDGVQRVRFVGMTPAEQQTASKPPAEKNVTEAELAQIATDPKKAPEERTAASAALKRLDQSKLASRTVVNVPLPAAPGQTSLTGEEYLSSLPKATANQIRAVAEGRATLPSATSRSQAAQQIRQGVFQYDPDFSEQKAQIRKAFTSGSDGRNIGALNTAAVHLDQLAEVSKALDNGSFRPGNALWNATKTMFGGSTPTNFEGLKSAVAGEMASALKGNATDQEIHNIAQSIQSKNSPQQLADYIETQLHVLGAKLNTYQERYQQQIPGDSKWSPVLPSARSVFDKHGFNPTAGPGAATPKDAAGPSLVTTKAQYDALPKGTLYKESDGKTYRKP